MPSQEYKDYLESPAWKQKSSFVKRKERCYICSYDWKDRRGGYLTTHHTRYYDAKGKSILGREGPRDLVPLCDRHHVRGRCGWDTLRLMKLTYRLWKPARALLLLPWRATLCLLSLLRRK
jgi:hypothetical protein